MNLVISGEILVKEARFPQRKISPPPGSVFYILCSLIYILYSVFLPTFLCLYIFCKCWLKNNLFHNFIHSILHWLGRTTGRNDFVETAWMVSLLTSWYVKDMVRVSRVRGTWRWWWWWEPSIHCFLTRPPPTWLGVPSILLKAILKFLLQRG